jgi:ketosteroid isomerase-like protein
MSQRNVEVVARMYQHQTTLETMEEILEFIDPDVEWLPRLAPSVSGASYRGHAGVRQWVEDTLEVWEQFGPESIEIIDAGDHVVVHARWRGRGRASNIEIDDYVTQVFTFRGGKVVRAESFTDRARALEAAGLRG